ncbi:hypothetical protein J2810_000317 [Chryseobacterium rhizosphaerae]|uniref:hypothetical protein n=1 Tax=Chryseobacterium rhizosphaerae TaxID=395937 RepID=UPI000AF4C375|nr:hypothetical protein [Chryseobacterium rhizosphaerae]MDR6544295.1 hypothetical protein [Chryseobacterium rhizosphaerae]
MEKLKIFANKNNIIWALCMSSISTFILFLIGFFYLTNVDSSALASPFSILVYFVLLYFIFKIFTYYKKLTILGLVASIFIFFFLYLLLFLYADKNKDYLENIIKFIPIKEWDSNGYDPAEEELSSQFCGIMTLIVLFLQILFINLLPDNFLENKKLVNYTSIGVIAVVIITLTIVIFFS